MDAWQRTFDQLRTVFRGLSVTQRASLLVVALGLLGGLGWFACGTAFAKDEFLLGGKNFSPAELSRTQAALQSAGLTQAHVVGQKISVPAAEADRYTAAALAQQTLPAQFAAEFDRMQSKVNVFTSTEQRRELLEEARKTRLAQILRAIPEIEDAVVEWDRPKATNLFRPAPQLAAHVSVKPRGGRELSLELVQSLKQFVAGALAGAQTDDVTVVDMNTSRVYGRRTALAAASDRSAGLAKQHADEYSTRINLALRYIPEVLVSVNVELIPDITAEDPREKLFVGADFVPVSHRRDRRRPAAVARSNHPPLMQIDPVSATAFGRDMEIERSGDQVFQDSHDRADVLESENASFRKSVQVAVSIPEGYYSAIARSRGMSPGESVVRDSAYRALLADIKAETQRDVREKLIRLLPRGSDPSSLSVTTYTPLTSAAEVAESAASLMNGSSFAIDLTDWSQHWQLGTGAAICGLCCLWVVFRSRPRPDRLLNATALNTPEPEPLPLDETDLIPPPTAPHAAVLDKLAELERHSPARIATRDNGFAFLDELSAIDAAQMLETEHPQTIALVATALTHAHAANILHSLPESLRWDVTQRLSRIGPAIPDVLREVAVSLQSRMQQRSAADYRTSSENAVPTSLPTPLATVETPAWPLKFADLQTLVPRSVAVVLSAIEPRTCAVALLDQSAAFKQTLLGKLPTATSSSIRQQLKNLGPVRLLDITASQNAIVEVAWNLFQEGLIALPEQLANAA